MAPKPSGIRKSDRVLNLRETPSLSSLRGRDTRGLLWTLRLLTASREIEGSHVPVLRDYLEELLSPRPMP